MRPLSQTPIVVCGARSERPSTCAAGCGSAAWWATTYPLKDGPNEDALAVIPAGDGRAVFAVADGFGGQPAGDQAARIAIESIVAAVSAGIGLRGAILNGFESANRAVMAMGVGAATTLAVAEIDGEVVRPYHVGDSEIVIVGQRGKIKWQSVSHSPVGYGVEAGMIDRDEALHHDQRNIVSNHVGSADMHIDIGPRIRLRPKDTLLLATDGVFDNLARDEIVEVIRKGSLLSCCKTLVEAGLSRMTQPEPRDPTKPDDIAAILFRPVRRADASS